MRLCPPNRVRVPRANLLGVVALMAVTACSGGGSGGSGVTADVTVGGADTGVKADADAEDDAGAVDSLVDSAGADDGQEATDAASLDADPGDAVDDGDAEEDLSGFFDDIVNSDGGAIVCGDSGLVQGVACAPKAGVSVAYAAVTLDVQSPCLSGTTTYHADTQADAKGAYTFKNVPPGVGTVGITKGSFKTSIPVNIEGGKTIDLTQPTSDRCFKASGVKIAVIQGDSDEIGALLDDLGFAHDDFATGASGTVAKSAAATFLTNLTKMNTYDVIFVNCGGSLDSLISAKPTILTNVQAFVNAGHSFYASDWAWQIVEGAFPNAIDFWGDDAKLSKSTTGPSTTLGPRQGPGPTLAEKKAGAPAFTMNGTVVDTGLATVLGKATTTIYEDLGTWVVMQKPGAGTVVEVETALTDGKGGDWGTVPLVVRFSAGQGHVVYTSFHNIAVKDAGGPVDDIKTILTYLVFTL